ncbi:hypothetical protein [Haloplanus salilacus]|uniref:hypothetical protein n=1 Tax=Haloplanus salilacus TaxID=2949994 RepID=UPI0030CB92A3
MAEDGGGGGFSRDDLESLLPDFIFYDSVARLGEQVRNAGGPVRWVRQRIVEYVLGAVAALIFGVADVIDQMWGIVIMAIDQAGAAVPQSVQSAGTGLVVVIGDFHTAVVGVATVAGPASPIIVVGIYAVTLSLVFIALRAAAPALTDLLGSVPVIGSVLDALLTFAIQLSDRVVAFLGGDG